jgi:CRISPR-associated protein Cas1
MVVTNFSTGEKNSVPVEDIAVVELDNPQIVLNHYLMQFLAENKVAIITNSQAHLPNGLLLPIDGHHSQSLHIRAQINIKKPLKNQIWKKIVFQKIFNQMKTLEYFDKNTQKLNTLLGKIRSGDKSNIEGQASKYYWKELFGKDFSRNPEGPTPNEILNYAYSMIRSLAAREIVAAGLHPTIGIHHKSQYNSYCLADDIMEPYRPYADLRVKELQLQEVTDEGLTKYIKYELLSLFISEIKINNESKTMVNAMQDTCKSLLKSYLDKEEKIKLPELHGVQPV